MMTVTEPLQQSRDRPADSLEPHALRLTDLRPILAESEGIRASIEALRDGVEVSLDGAWGSATALITAALIDQAPERGTALIVLPHAGDLEDFRQDLASFSGSRPEIFPIANQEDGGESIGQRIRLTRRLVGPMPPRAVVTTLPALMTPVPRPDRLEALSRRLEVGREDPLEEVTRWLVDQGLARVEVVEEPGEFAVRGGILDIYPPEAAEPIRIEYFGDEVDSIRTFDVATQRSRDRLDTTRITSPQALAKLSRHDRESLVELIPGPLWIVLFEAGDVRAEAQAYRQRVEDADGLDSPEEAMARLVRFPLATLATLAPDTALADRQTHHLRIESIERFGGDLGKLRTELDQAAGSDRVLIACGTEAEANRLRDVLAETKTAQDGRLIVTIGQIRSGFRLVEAGLVVVADHELFSRAGARTGSVRRRYESRAIDSFLDLREGDHVVHVNHGIAIYRGLRQLGREDMPDEESLTLEFAAGTKLYIPVAQIHLVQKYVGSGKASPQLSKLGGTSWEKKKRRVREAIMDLASELIEVQAERQSKPGFAFPDEDSRWQEEFDASFPYQETPDQERAIEAVKRDMAQPKPMDRLICGDVGYGKTEVAMRAAFKAVDAGKQVAVLVPTTILAEQHYQSFRQRLAAFPFNIEVLNRFRARKEVREALKRVALGGVDIVIGTHRIVQKDVAFKDLGLVIIDEEQRFGVEDKEWLKQLRATVDVMTMSATPIPRTLHLSLVGIRDISNLETPPPDRKAIETRIARFDGELIRRAIGRELDRGGQVYFVHNRVHDIEQVAEGVRDLLPDARILVGHGQMTGDQLERTMLKFVRHEADILVATTIIESGLDIPNANTIIINDADRFGLAELHQLRGRVGRSSRRAYCYLLIEQKRTVSPDAIRRLKAIEEFTDLGAGFKIALRDLEIRGAGNILGAQQSGHIESVGYELFCQLLESTVRVLQGKPAVPQFDCRIELPWRTYLPKTYVSSTKVKLELYRRIGRLRSLERLDDFRQELVDRFGALPPSSENLLVEAELRILAERWQLKRIHLEGLYAVLTYRNARRIEKLAQLHPEQVRIVDDASAYVPLGEEKPKTPQIASILRTLLRAGLD